ncbi:hypothetical protein CEUSTIGMA_g962.t1 [Chlamydomonas eustigma]|uniref:TLC domain-containing protein n=1 Tax=Chlamydomonas eustigma TaxID=1157962 RepID=A0A250WSJ7_9CHLO|nr:hypothetical protein CEUSTIGMA_g962.t1 [Chlamydomonas eustigma]|eukprot:GAX73510.1 hypothetical protein CEUSTIGMA_g962.t1 [Chlamydomonas eustigma]
MNQENECPISGLVGFLHLNNIPHYVDFLATVWIAFALLSINLFIDSSLKRVVVSWLCKQAPAEKLRAVDASDFFDNAYLAVVSTVLGALCWTITIAFNDQCTPWSSNHCLESWPNQKALPIQRLYFIVSFQFYLCEVMGTALGSGAALKQDMMVHHAAVMTCMCLGYHFHFLRYGIMWMGLFDISNPLLHFSKMLHALKMIPSTRIYKKTAFISFTSVFFVARVLCPPLSVLKPAMHSVFHLLPVHWAAFFVGSMLFIYGLQVYWFVKIVDVWKKQFPASKAAVMFVPCKSHLS